MSSSESSPWSQWPSLLLPRPKLRHFWQKPHSKSSSALSLASGTTLFSNSTLKDLRRPSSFRSLSAVYTSSGKSTNVMPQALEQRARVDDAPPQLKPLILARSLWLILCDHHTGHARPLCPRPNQSHEEDSLHTYNDIWRLNSDGGIDDCIRSFATTVHVDCYITEVVFLALV
ncbi:hypothetical protein BDZ97DRAFT_1143331 [Flammula alnicola]|nr:hypothetical protein BDZ97DRAFT_1143331 [Flammula alnicola]